MEATTTWSPSPDVPDERLQLRTVRRALAGLLLGEGLVALPHRLELPGEVLAGR